MMTLISTAFPKPLYAPGQRFRLELNSLAQGFVLLCDGRVIQQDKIRSGLLSFSVEDSWRECQVVVFGIPEGNAARPLDFASFSVRDTCRSQVGVSVIGASKRKPGERLDVRLRGGSAFANGLAGLSAVDERVRYLARAIAEEEGEAEAAAPSWAFLHTAAADWALEGFIDRKALTRDVERRCNEAGRLWWTFNASCPVFQESRVSLVNLCQREFSAECQTTVGSPDTEESCQRQKGRKSCPIARVEVDRRTFAKEDRSKSLLSASPVTPVAVEPPPPSIRSFFPHTWLFESFRLNSQGLGGVRRTLPDSVTNWTLLGDFWTEGRRGLCRSRPLAVTAFKPVFLRVEAPKEVYRNEELLLKATIFYFGDLDRAESHIPLSLCHAGSSGVCTDVGHSGVHPGRSLHLTLIPRRSRTASKVLSYQFLELGLQNLSFTLHHGRSSHPCSRRSLVDEVKLRVLVVEREEVSELRRTYVMSPAKPKTALTLTKYRDGYTRYTEKSEDVGPESLAAELVLQLGEEDKVKAFEVHVAQLGPGPASLPALLATPLPNRRPKRSSITFSHVPWEDTKTTFRSVEAAAKPFLSEYLGDLAELLFNDQTGQPAFDQKLEQLLSETMTFGNWSEAGSEGEGDEEVAYSNTRWPRPGDAASPWLTVLTAGLHCRAEVSSSVVCPSLRHLIRRYNGESERGSGERFFRRPWSLVGLASGRDEELLLQSLFFLALYDCEAYMDQCFGQRAPWNEAAERLYWAFHIHHPPSTDPVALAAVSYAVTRANSPLQNVFLDDLVKRADGRGSQPHWSYSSPKAKKQNYLSQIWSRLTGWLSKPKERMQRANEVLINSLGLLAFSNQSVSRFPLDKDPIADWLASHVDADLGSPLATYFLHRSLADWRRLESLPLGPGNLSVELQCAGCPPMKRSLGRRDGYVLHVPRSTDRLRIVGKGRGKIKLSVHLRVADADARRKRSHHNLASADSWPVKMESWSRLVSGEGGRLIEHKVCLSTSHGVLSDYLAVEHGLFTGTEPVDGSPVPYQVSRTRDVKAAVRNVEVASHQLAFLLLGLQAGQRHCYKVLLRRSEVGHSGLLASVPVRVRHASQGLVGQLFLPFPQSVEPTQPSPEGSGEGEAPGRGVRDVFLPSGTDKFCWSGEDCVCTERACHKRCGACSTSGHVRSLRRFLCHRGHFGAVLKAKEVERKGSYVRMRGSVKHVTVDEDELAEEMGDGQEAEIWQRSDCPQSTTGQPCPEVVKNELYFVAGSLERLQRDANSSLPLYFVGDRDHVARLGDCSGEFRNLVVWQLAGTAQARRDACRGFG